MPPMSLRETVRSRIAGTSLAAFLALCVSGCPSGLPPHTTASQAADAPLARRLERRFEKTGARVGFVAVHVESGRRLAIRGDEVFEAASVIKLGHLAEAAARVTSGRLELSERWKLTPAGRAAPASLLNQFDDGLEPTERDLLELMIQRSDNTATNHFQDLLGMDAINARLRSLGFTTLELVGRIPDNDPEETQAARWKGLKLGNMTPRETAAFYERLVKRQLVDPKTDALMWHILSGQNSTSRLARLVLEGPKTAWAGKTGTMRGTRNDSGVVSTPRGRFVFVFFANGIPDGRTDLVNAAMGEAAKLVLDTWWRDLPELPPPPPDGPFPRTLPPALPRTEVTPLEVTGETPNRERVYRDADRLFWDLYGKAGGNLADSCLVPMPSSWWEGDDGWKIEPISSIVLHHTAIHSDEGCIQFFHDPASLVSAHFLVGLDGRLYQFVSLEHRAWHAGSSLLHGTRRLNRTSVGIEITGDGNFVPFTKAQIETTVKLLGVLVAQLDVKAPFIAGHQHIAPGRKPDPGAFFPWNDIVRRGLELAEKLKPSVPQVPEP